MRVLLLRCQPIASLALGRVDYDRRIMHHFIASNPTSVPPPVIRLIQSNTRGIRRPLNLKWES